MNAAPKGTQRHAIRIDDDLWGRFTTEAEKLSPPVRGKASGTSLVLRDLIRWWLREPGAKQPPRPARAPAATDEA